MANRPPQEPPIEQAFPEVERRATVPLAPHQQLEARVDDTMRLVVIALMAVALLSVFIVGALAFERRQVPDALIGIGSAGVAALATLVSRVGKGNNG